MANKIEGTTHFNSYVNYLLYSTYARNICKPGPALAEHETKHIPFLLFSFNGCKSISHTGIFVRLIIRSKVKIAFRGPAQVRDAVNGRQTPHL